ncbi:MAG TPA: contractile injection system tape measure protein, partial [Verrucomicrobiae bacterium]|nr:contractile injection system tape measure protein [Verrucomicrobiae bacterium]
VLPADPVETAPPLTQAQKDEADRMLEAVIANWGALKNTSPDGLRATFLQREGALRQVDDHWRLALARTGFDVLLDRLPWAISLIRLPWMPWRLQTDWS